MGPRKTAPTQTLGTRVIDPFVLFLLLVSPAIGSFLALLVDRLPRGEDTVRRRSFCRACGAQLRIMDVIPVLSFLAVKGRCRQCGAEIPPWLLYMEITAVGLAVFAVIAAQNVADMAASAGFLWLLLGLAVADLKWMRLPDSLTAALLLIALLGSLVPGGVGIEQALIGAALGAGSFFALRVGYRALRGREGLGMGDVKLMAGLGAYAGPMDLPLLVLMGAGLGLLGAMHIFGLRAKLSTQAVPFGSALCLAAGLLWAFRAAGLLN